MANRVNDNMRALADHALLGGDRSALMQDNVTRFGGSLNAPFAKSALHNGIGQAGLEFGLSSPAASVSTDESAVSEKTPMSSVADSAHDKEQQEDQSEILSATKAAQEASTKKQIDAAQSIQDSATDTLVDSSKSTSEHSSETIIHNSEKNSERVMENADRNSDAVVSSIDSMGQSIDEGFKDQQRSSQEMIGILSDTNSTMSKLYDLQHSEANKIEPKTQQAAWSSKRGSSSAGGAGSDASEPLENGTFFSDIGELLGIGGAAAAAGATVLSRGKGRSAPEPMDGSNARGSNGDPRRVRADPDRGPKLRGKAKILGALLGAFGMASMLDSSGNAYRDSLFEDEEAQDEVESAQALKSESTTALESDLLSSSLAVPAGLAAVGAVGVMGSTVQRANLGQAAVEGGSVFVDRAVDGSPRTASSIVNTTVNNAGSTTAGTGQFQDRLRSMASSGEEALRRTAQKASDIAKSAVDSATTNIRKLSETSADMIKRSTPEAVKSVEQMTQKAAAIADTAKSGITKTVDAAKHVFESTDSSLVKSSSSAVTKITEVSSKAASAIAPAASAVTKGMSKALPVIGQVMTAMEVYDIATDDSLSTSEKALTGAKLAGGTAGAMGGMGAGAAAGAAIGSVVPILGTAAGGIIGGLIGAVGGYFAGDAAVDTIYDTVSEVAEDSDVSDAIGRAVAVPMSLFSEDARSALSSDIEENVMPALSSFKQDVLDFFGFTDDVDKPEVSEVEPAVPSAESNILVETLNSETQRTTYPNGDVVTETSEPVTAQIMSPASSSSAGTVTPLLDKTILDTTVKNREIQNTREASKIESIEKQAQAAVSSTAPSAVERVVEQNQKLKEAIEKRDVDTQALLVERKHLALSSVREDLKERVSDKVRDRDIVDSVAVTALESKAPSVEDVGSNVSVPAADAVQSETIGSQAVHSLPQPITTIMSASSVPSASTSIPSAQEKHSPTKDGVAVSPSSADKASSLPAPTLQTVQENPVVRSKHEEVKKVMMIEPKMQKSANTNTSKPNSQSQRRSGGVTHSVATKPVLQDVPAVISDHGLVMINTGFL